MGEPSTTNGTAQTVNQIISGLLFDAAIPVAEAAAIAAAPWLGFPVVKQLFDLGLRTIGGFIYNALAIQSTFLVIDIQIVQEKETYIQAEADLRAAHLSGDPYALSQAISNFRQALASIIHYDGSASP